MKCALNKSIILLFIFLINIYFIIGKTLHFEFTYWGPDKEKPDDKIIKPYKISIPKADLEDLNKRINRTRKLTPPVVDDFTYGFNTIYLGKFIEFWIKEYNWAESETYLNQYPQFMTEINGLNIHFLQVKPDQSLIKGKEVIPLLMIHGWPTTAFEFYKIIPLLTTPRPDADFVFAVIAPSIPGFAFSEAAFKPGLDVGHIGLIFNELMTRLGFEHFYIQGDDWGSMIGRAMSIHTPERVLGYHSSYCSALANYGKLEKYIIKENNASYHTSKTGEWYLQSGFIHLQATKPDTIGVALTDSPVGLAAYILEIFSTWTNKDWMKLPDGGLENLDKTALLDNIMVYWLTSSMTTSMRLYKELSVDTFSKEMLIIPTNAPTGCIYFKHEMELYPHQAIKESIPNLISFNLQSTGGHFAALEVPHLLSADIWNFMTLVRKQR